MDDMIEMMTVYETLRKDDSIEAFLIESNKIEGIEGTNEEEIKAFKKFLKVKILTIPSIIALLKTFQPDTKLRSSPGMDVRVGNYTPPKGGELIPYNLQNLLDAINTSKVTPWRAHMEYEKLHPFTDGNGRSGRMIWWWQMGGSSLGFLHKFYYQTLENGK